MVLDIKPRVVIASLLLVFIAESIKAQETEQLLNTLDSVIALSEYYTQKKIDRINKLKTRFDVYKSDNNNEKEYETSLDLFYEYQSFVYDSAFYYIEKAKSEATQMNSPVKLANAKIKQGFVLLSSGLFTEAIETLESINVSILPDAIKAEYYSVFARAYYDLADYSQDPVFSKKHKSTGNEYLAKALELTPEDTNDYWARESLMRMKKEDWRGARHAFNYWVNNYDMPRHYKGIATSSLGYIYSLSGANDKAMEYLIKAAIADVETATKETVALRNLAKILFEAGNKKRAYEYIILAMEDAEYYNARHRKIQIATILPIIEGERLDLVESQKSDLIWLAMLSLSLAVFVIFFVVIIYKQLTKLKKARKVLQTSLKKLNASNIKLKEADKIKEEYIGYFLNVNSEYIDKLDTLQKKVLNKINARKYEDLLHFVKNTNMRKERQHLFREFDEVFLKIFPNFIEDFNSFFKEEDKIVLKKNELLNAELRIFGLIRLGINDNEKLAKFLNYSVTTIYTYKTKLKAKSIYKDNFHEKLMEIKAV